jgi:hypothetical protein
MVLSHNDMTSPVRRQLLVGVIGLIAFVALMAPSASLLQRLTALLMVILIGAMAYGGVLVFLRVLAVISPWFAKLYALLCYYGGIASVPFVPIVVALAPGDAHSDSALISTSPYLSQVLPVVTFSVCAAAAGYKWLRSAHVA